jgi:hypothetical protein
VAVNYIGSQDKAEGVVDAIRKNGSNAIALKANICDGRQYA